MNYKLISTVFLVTTQLINTVSCIEILQKNAPTKKTTHIAVAKKPPVVCVTIPKCGTHLLMKCLSLLGDPSMNYHYEKWSVSEKVIKLIRAWNKLPPPHHFKGRFYPPTFGPMPLNLEQGVLKSKIRLFERHFPYTQKYNQFLDRHEAIKFLLLRDPRAMVVSLAYMIHKGFDEGQISEIEPIILDLIDGRKKNYVPWGVEIQEAYPPIWEVGVTEYYKTFLPFLTTKNCLLIRFEDLIGEQGGGSKETQIYQIQTIAHHAGIQIDAQKALDISETLFGGSGTFREGKIDGWKKHFTPTVKQAFKNAPGANKLLIDLGYEKDETW